MAPVPMTLRDPEGHFNCL